MRLGIQISWFTYPDGPAGIASHLARIARNSEDAGLTSLFVMDHFFQIQMVGPPELDMLEAYTTLGWIGAQTSTLELATLVTGVTYRNPAILAKTVTTLDVLTGGRAMLGIGAAWNEEEHAGYGIEFPSVRERFVLLEDTLKVCRQMFDGDDSSYAGERYDLDRPLNNPNPLHRIPILIGGGGEKKTLRLVAQYADACNIFDMGPAAVKAKYDVIDAHCADVGRDPAEIERTVLARLALTKDGAPHAATGQPTQTVDQAVQHLAGLAGVGTQRVILGMVNQDEDDAYPLLAEVVRQVADL